MPRTQHSALYRKTSPATAKSYRQGADRTLEDWTAAITAADSPKAKRALVAGKQAALQRIHPPRRSPERAEEAEPDKCLTRNGEDWRRILQEKQVEDRRRRGDLSSSAEVAGGIKDPSLRRLFERSRAREGRRPARSAAVRQKSQVAKFESVQAATQKPIGSKDPDALKIQATGPYAHGLAMRETIGAVCMRPDLSSIAKSVALVLSSHWPHVQPRIERLMLLTGIRSNKTIYRALVELKQHGLLRWKQGHSRRANLYECLWLSPAR